MELGVQVQRRHRCAVEDALANGFSILTIEGLMIGHHFVKHCAKTEQVRARVDSLAANLLRRQVREDRREAGHLSRKLAHAGDAVSENSDHPVPATHDLGGLQTIVKYV